MYTHEALEARGTLARCRVPLGADFFTLSTTQVMDLLAEAVRHEIPQAQERQRLAAGGTFHARLQRRAQRIE